MDFWTKFVQKEYFRSKNGNNQKLGEKCSTKFQFNLISVGGN